MSTEVLAAAGAYWAVATFLSETEMQAQLTDCLVAAGLALSRDHPETVALGVLVQHDERRFRLDRLLGAPGSPAAQRFYGEILAALRHIGAERRAEHPANAESLGDEELGRGFRAHGTLHSLTRQLGAHLADRLRALPDGSLHPPGATWPQYWTHGHADRAGLLAALEPFLTDDRRRFGAIVAPLVNGLRVRGAFSPSWNGQLPYLEVLDSEGLVATPRQPPMLLPASILGQLERSDAILLVDDGRKPMGAVASVTFAQLVRAGCLKKLSICFTHFDELEGLDPSTSRARRRFPQATRKQAGVALCQERGQWLEEPMQWLETQRVFHLAGLHLGQHLPSATRDELDRLEARIRFGDTHLAAPGHVAGPAQVVAPARVTALTRVPR